jgi:pimeloyl-ACP methyl ester carboxylesterase
VNAIHHATIRTNGISLHVAAAGPLGGPLVILLHGFPDSWYGWRKQIAFLADRGFRVLAPDQRGYNTSDKPAGVAAYRIDELARDVVGLIDQTGRERAHVVGHDWGGGVAWRLGVRYPERLDRLVVMNCPHPSVMMKALRTNVRQLGKSWYMFYFQLPWLPEAGFSGGKMAERTARAMARTANPGSFTEEDLVKYREAWAQPGAARGMLNWYRAIFRRGRRERAAARKVRVPTLLVWGAHDAFLGRELAYASLACCEDVRLEVLEEATHWVQVDEPERVNRLLEEFLVDREAAGAVT